jgi:hypothetical protein
LLGPGQLPGQFHDDEVLQDWPGGTVWLVEACGVLADTNLARQGSRDEQAKTDVVTWTVTSWSFGRNIRGHLDAKSAAI